MSRNQSRGARFPSLLKTATMKRLLTILALLPLTAVGQSTERIIDVIPTEPIFQSRFHHGCSVPGRPCSGVLYIIDGVKIETINPLPVAPAKLLVDINNPTTLKLERNDIMTLPYTDITDMVSLSTSIHQQQRGAANHVGGSRQEDILYVIDGMQVARR
jgi:hypothetical protein